MRVPVLQQMQKEATEEEEPCCSELQTIWNLPGEP